MCCGRSRPTEASRDLPGAFRAVAEVAPATNWNTMARADRGSGVLRGFHRLLSHRGHCAIPEVADACTSCFAASWPLSGGSLPEGSPAECPEDSGAFGRGLDERCGSSAAGWQSEFCGGRYRDGAMDDDIRIHYVVGDVEHESCRLRRAACYDLHTRRLYEGGSMRCVSIDDRGG